MDPFLGLTRFYSQKQGLDFAVFFLCVCTCVVNALHCVYEYRAWMSLSSIFLDHCPPYFFETASLPEPGYTDWPESPLDPAATTSFVQIMGD